MVAKNNNKELFSQIEEQKKKILCEAYNCLLSLHGLFFNKLTKDYAKRPNCISGFARLIKKNPQNPNVYKLLKYCIHKSILKPQYIDPLNISKEKLYVLDKDNLEKEIEAWKIFSDLFNYLINSKNHNID